MSEGQYYPQQQYPPAYPPPDYYQQQAYAPQRPSSGLGITALVLGISALVLAFVPFIGLLSFLLAPAAIVLGIIAFVKRQGRGQGLAGAITGGVSLLVIIGGVILFGALLSASESEVESLEQPVEDVDDESTEDIEEGSQEEAAAEDEQDTEDDITATALGEEAVITDTWSGEDIGTITVDEITADFQCTQGNEVWEPESGAFIALDATVEVDSSADENLSINGWDFYVLDEDNSLIDVGIGSPAEYACVPSAETLDTVRPGTTSSGYILLDVAIGSGTVVYEGGGENIHWEF